MKKVLMDLSKYLGVKGLRGVAHYYGVPESRIYSWTKKGRIANPGLILSRNPELSEEWVATGRGPMLADKAMGRRRRRMSPQAEATTSPELPEMAAEQEIPLAMGRSNLINQVIAIVDAGGEAKAILEAQVKALSQSLERERQQKLLLAELSQIRTGMDNMLAMLNQVVLPAAKGEAAASEGEQSNWE